MTNKGGQHNRGVLFEFDPSTNTYAKKIDFNGLNGAYPNGSLTQASNGKLYGLTGGGGSTAGINGGGVLFEYDPVSNTHTVKFDFDLQLVSGSIVNYSGTNGCHPVGSLIKASNNKLYGIALEGGINGGGVIFEYDPDSDTYTKRVDFDSLGHPGGSQPNGTLIQAMNGKLYGTLWNSGEICPSGCSGSIFEYDPASNSYNKVFTFNDQYVTGSDIYGTVMQAANGKLYGVAYAGGANVGGVIYHYDLETQSFTPAISLIYQSLQGHAPNGQLLQASNGKFYGTTSGGGSAGLGVLFEYGQLYSKLHDFSGTGGFNPSVVSHLIEITGPYSCSPPSPGQLCPNGSITLLAGLSGTSYQWQVNTGTGYVNLSDDANHNGVATHTLQLNNMPTSSYGHKYRCLVDGNNNNVFELKFSVTWSGSVSNAWENPLNWSCGILPDENTDVIVNTGTVVVNSSAYCRSLDIKTVSNLSVNTGYKLTITK